jgi:hypothetical protein
LRVCVCGWGFYHEHKGLQPVTHHSQRTRIVTPRLSRCTAAATPPVRVAHLCVYKREAVVRVCVCVRERERESVCVCVCVCSYLFTLQHTHRYLEFYALWAQQRDDGWTRPQSPAHRNHLRGPTHTHIHINPHITYTYAYICVNSVCMYVYV